MNRNTRVWAVMILIVLTYLAVSETVFHYQLSKWLLYLREPAYLPHDHSGFDFDAETRLPFPKDRPLRQGQLDPEDIETGDILISFKAEKYVLKILIVTPPYTKDGKCVFDYVWWEDTVPYGSFIWTGYCSDNGLIEYDSGVWNSTNYLIRSDEASLSPEEVQETIKDMVPEPSLDDIKPKLQEKAL